MSLKEKLEEQLKDKIDQWEAETERAQAQAEADRAKAKADETAAEVRKEATEHVQALQAKLDDAREKLGELRRSSADSAEKLYDKVAELVS